jgi:hypothetical protein
MLKLKLNFKFFSKLIDEYLKIQKEPYFKKFMTTHQDNDSYFISTLTFTEEQKKKDREEEKKEIKITAERTKKYPLIHKAIRYPYETYVLEGTDVFNVKFIMKSTYDSVDGVYNDTTICQNPIHIYTDLKSLSFLRDGKIYEQDPDMMEYIYEVWANYFVCLGYVGEQNRIVSSYDLNISILESELIKLFKQRYPFKYKNYSKIEDSKCSESSHGLIYGLVHEVRTSNLESILESEWLDPFYNPGYDWKQGVYMKLITINNEQDIIRSRNTSLIFSVSLLDDLDYYGNEEEAAGSRGSSSFYKGVKSCPKDLDNYGNEEEAFSFYKGVKSCPKDLDKYSSAERAVIYDKDRGEIIFREPISLRRYLEKIIIPNGKRGEFPQFYQDMMISQPEKGVYYRKNCNSKVGKWKKSLLDKYRDKYEQISEDLIPEEDLIELVKRSKVRLVKETEKYHDIEIPYKKI